MPLATSWSTIASGRCSGVSPSYGQKNASAMPAVNPMSWVCRCRAPRGSPRGCDDRHPLVAPAVRLAAADEPEHLVEPGCDGPLGAAAVGDERPVGEAVAARQPREQLVGVGELRHDVGPHERGDLDRAEAGIGDQLDHAQLVGGRNDAREALQAVARPDLDDLHRLGIPQAHRLPPPAAPAGAPWRRRPPPPPSRRSRRRSPRAPLGADELVEAVAQDRLGSRSQRIAVAAAAGLLPDERGAGVHRVVRLLGLERVLGASGSMRYSRSVLPGPAAEQPGRRLVGAVGLRRERPALDERVRADDPDAAAPLPGRRLDVAQLVALGAQREQPVGLLDRRVARVDREDVDRVDAVLAAAPAVGALVDLDVDPVLGLLGDVAGVDADADGARARRRRGRARPRPAPGSRRRTRAGSGTRATAPSAGTSG